MIGAMLIGSDALGILGLWGVDSCVMRSCVERDDSGEIAARTSAKLAYPRIHG